MSGALTRRWFAPISVVFGVVVAVVAATTAFANALTVADPPPNVVYQGGPGRHR